MGKIEVALERFLKGFNCTQAIFATYSQEFGLNEDIANKIASPFGGGFARRGDICGVITGALMVIGLKYGNTNPEDKETKKKTYIKGREFIRKFIEKNGTIICRELIKCNISTFEGRKKAEEEKLILKICPNFIKSGIEILESIL